MDGDTFIGLVGQRAGVGADEAVNLTRATLRTLGERITGGDALDLAARLPEPLQPELRRTGESVDRFGVAEFVRRVAERARLDETGARDGVRVVFVTLREAIISGEFDDVMARLPDEFEDLFAPMLAPGVTGGRPRA